MHYTSPFASWLQWLHFCRCLTMKRVFANFSYVYLGRDVSILLFNLQLNVGFNVLEKMLLIVWKIWCTNEWTIQILVDKWMNYTNFGWQMNEIYKFWLTNEWTIQISWRNSISSSLEVGPYLIMYSILHVFGVSVEMSYNWIDEVDKS